MKAHKGLIFPAILFAVIALAFIANHGKTESITCESHSTMAMCKDSDDAVVGTRSELVNHGYDPRYFNYKE